METIDSINKALSDACELALKQPILGKQLFFTTDASFRTTGCALMIEGHPDQKILSNLKTHAHVASVSKIFSPEHLKMSKKPKKLQ